MRLALLLIGNLLLGGAAGYITGRWKIVYVFLLGLLGLSLIADPQLPGLIGEGDAGSWAETFTFIVGIIVGSRFGEKDAARV